MVNNNGANIFSRVGLSRPLLQSSNVVAYLAPVQLDIDHAPIGRLA